MLRMMQKMDAFDFDRELLLARRELYPLALKFTENKEDAEDLLQETMIKALCNRNKFDTNTNFKGWLYTIMHNLFINNCYLKDNHHEAMDDLPESVLSEFAMENDYDAKEIARTIKTIPEHLRLPFLMSVNGFKYREIAAHTGLSIGAVKSRIFCCKRRLKNLLCDFCN